MNRQVVVDPHGRIVGVADRTLARLRTCGGKLDPTPFGASTVRVARDPGAIRKELVRR
jgi:hypothetical protein